MARHAPRVAGRVHADTVAGRAVSGLAEPCARRQAELSAEMGPVVTTTAPGMAGAASGPGGVAGLAVPALPRSLA